MHALLVPARATPSPATRPAARGPAALLFAFAACLAPAGLGAQTCPDGRSFQIAEAAVGEVQEVTLVGGATYMGRVLAGGDPVRFELLSRDVLEIARERIVCLRTIAGTRQDGEFWREDPNETRLFFGPTGRALGQGEGYFSVVEILMPFLSFGITDRVTVSGGMPLIFTAEGPELAWLAPKVEVVRTDAFRGSLGVLAFFVAGEGSAGVLYAVGTFGRTTDHGLTVGTGWGYSSGDGIYEAPAFMLGGETRTGRSTKIITENYFFPDESFGILSVGPRFFGERLSADLGLTMPFGTGVGFFVFPLVNFAWNW